MDKIKKKLQTVKSTIGDKIPKKGKKPEQFSKKNQFSKQANIKINRSLAQKRTEKKDLRARKKAEDLAKLPKSRFGRLIYKLHPVRVFKFWFSRDGLILGLKLSGIGFVVMFLFLFGVFAYFRKDLPKTTTELIACSEGETTSYYDRTGNTLLWSSKGDVECIPVQLDQISKHLQNAVIASEDKDFYKHGGFSLSGVIRAAVNNYRGESTQGGSTITQQYVKNAILRDDERTITRKIKELILSVELSRNFTKDEILNAYLNEILFGSVYNGAEAASRGYFNKSAKDLTPEESALFVAAIPAPNYYWNNPEEHQERKNHILNLMADQGYLTKEESEAAKQVDVFAKVIESKSKYKDMLHPYFVLGAVEEMEEIYGKNVQKLGYKVITTLDIELQKAAEESVAMGMPAVDKAGFDNAALTSIDVQSGEVVALVGGRDFNNEEYGNNNYAMLPRSPGSSFKPYDYAALMANSPNWGAGSIFYDMDTDFGGGYGARKNGIGFDYDGREPGGVSMRYALGGSRNTPAIKAMYLAGIKNTHDLTYELGIKSGITGCGDGVGGTLDCSEVLSTGIGDGGEIRLDEHVNAYATFARLGIYKPKTMILKVMDSKSKELPITRDSEKQVLDPQIAYIINDMMADRNASYFRLDKFYRDKVTNNFEKLDVPAGMKTGTTNNFDNGWLLGYTTRYATGVWVGHHENESSSIRGFENLTGPIWGEYMRRAHEGKDTPGWTRPAGIKEVAHDKDFYARVKAGCTPALLGNVCGYKETDIYPSWYVAKSTGPAKKAVIDTVTNKLATDCTPNAAKKEIVSGNIIAELPSTDSAYNRWVSAIQRRYGGTAGGAIPTEKDDLHQCSDVMPVVDLSVANSSGNIFVLKATVTQGTHALKSLTFKLNGQTLDGGVVEVSINGDYTYNYTAQEAGDLDFSVEVSDVALYTGSDNFSAKSTSGTSSGLNLKAPTISGGNATFNWTTLSGADKYELCITKDTVATPTCTTLSSSKVSYVTTTASFGGSGSYSAKLTASKTSGELVGKASTVTFTVE